MSLTLDEKIKCLTKIVDDLLSILYFDNAQIITTRQYQEIKKDIRGLDDTEIKNEG